MRHFPLSAFPQENIDNCEGVTCPEFQECVDLVDAHQCRCPPGLKGPSCDQDIDEYEDYEEQYDVYVYDEDHAMIHGGHDD